MKDRAADSWHSIRSISFQHNDILLELGPVVRIDFKLRSSRCLDSSCQMGDGARLEHGCCTCSSSERSPLQPRFAATLARGTGFPTHPIPWDCLHPPCSKFFPLFQYYRMELLNADKVEVNELTQTIVLFSDEGVAFEASLFLIFSSFARGGRCLSLPKWSWCVLIWWFIVLWFSSIMLSPERVFGSEKIHQSEIVPAQAESLLFFLVGGGGCCSRLCLERGCGAAGLPKSCRSNARYGLVHSLSVLH